MWGSAQPGQPGTVKISEDGPEHLLKHITPRQRDAGDVCQIAAPHDSPFPSNMCSPLGCGAELKKKKHMGISV